MKRIIILSILLVGLMAVYGYADQGGHMKGGMMGSPGYGETQKNPMAGYGGQGMMRPGMMGYGGYGMGPGMMGYGGYGMGPGMMGYGGYGMGSGMMGYGGCGNMGYGGYGMMGPGMMGNHQMMHGGYGMGSGMMGYGTPGMMGHHQMMHGGYGMGSGMMGYGGQGYNAEAYRKFMDETSTLRKKMHDKKFEYFEALRNPETKREDVVKMEKELQELQREIYEKRQK
jgi:hypothetical protein